jgi:toxin secretion/phage lysis holin
MKTLWNWISVALAAVGGFLGWFLGGLDGALYALFAFTVADYITGVFSAYIRKELSSEVGAKGIVKKVTIYIIVGIGHLADVHLLGGGNALRTALIFFYAANELVSLVENSAVIGLPIPQALKDTLTQLREKSNNAGKPDNAGNSDSTGKSEITAKPNNTGKSGNSEKTANDGCDVI